ncbi:hypothetical protein GF319_15775 [Candidatus Bathyarchaeota archaeon]|nr:hypothetical protein [Candidatus Bathyarchaeota archaeon]
MAPDYHGFLLIALEEPPTFPPGPLPPHEPRGLRVPVIRGDIDTREWVHPVEVIPGEDIHLDESLTAPHHLTALWTYTVIIRGHLSTHMHPRYKKLRLRGPHSS